MYPVWSLSLKQDENLNEISNVHVEAIQNGTLNAKYWGGKKEKTATLLV